MIKPTVPQRAFRPTKLYGTRLKAQQSQSQAVCRRLCSLPNDATITTYLSHRSNSLTRTTVSQHNAYTRQPHAHDTQRNACNRPQDTTAQMCAPRWGPRPQFSRNTGRALKPRCCRFKGKTLSEAGRGRKSPKGDVGEVDDLRTGT